MASESDERHMWSKVDLDILTRHIKINGFDGDIRSLQTLFPKFSESSIRSLLNRLKDDDEEKEADKENAPEEVNIDGWTKMLVDINETTRVGNNIPTMLQYIAKYEDLASAERCGGVDYPAIYTYLAALSKGHIPKQLNPPSARKVLEILEQLQYAAGEMADRSADFVRQHAKAPVHKVITKEEKNQILRDRRRPNWSEAELEQQRQFLSPDVNEAIKEYKKVAGLNPFQFPHTC